MKISFVLFLLIICFTPLESFGDECIEGDCVNGQGTMVYATGHKFSGAFKDGVRHGDGVLLMPGDRKIVGTWQNNEIMDGDTIVGSISFGMDITERNKAEEEIKKREWEQSQMLKSMINAFTCILFIH